MGGQPFGRHQTRRVGVGGESGVGVGRDGNLEHEQSGFEWGLDNWIYSAKSDQRYKTVQGVWVKEKTESRGQ